MSQPIQRSPTDPDGIQLEEVSLGRNRSSTDEDENLRLTGQAAASNNLVPRWTVWPGNNKFLFDGRAITGPERGAFTGTAVLVGVPMLLFYSSITPSLMKYRPDLWWLAVAALGGFGLIYVCLFKAHATDPGIIPREPYHIKGPRIISRVLDDGSTIRMRFCDTCHIYRPPRSHHCQDCGNCVEVFDHHCPWIGNCVARRNYRYFIGFLIWTTLMLVLVFAVCLVVLLSANAEKDSFGSALGEVPTSFILMIYTALIFFPVCCLTCYHGFIISTGETTKEEVRRMYAEEENPFDKGCLLNWWITFCIKAPPSRLTNLRELISPTYLEDGFDEEEDEYGDYTPSTTVPAAEPATVHTDHNPTSTENGPETPTGETEETVGVPQTTLAMGPKSTGDEDGIYYKEPSPVGHERTHMLETVTMTKPNEIEVVETVTMEGNGN